MYLTSYPYRISLRTERLVWPAEASLAFATASAFASLSPALVFTDIVWTLFSIFRFCISCASEFAILNLLPQIIDFHLLFFFQLGIDTFYMNNSISNLHVFSQSHDTIYIEARRSSWRLQWVPTKCYYEKVPPLGEEYCKILDLPCTDSSYCITGFSYSGSIPIVAHDDCSSAYTSAYFAGLLVHSTIEELLLIFQPSGTCTSMTKRW